MADDRVGADSQPRAEESRGGSREERERSKPRLDAFIPDMLRRTFYAGLGAIFTSEEGIRRLANDFSLPKDVANYLINQAQTTKNELFRVVAAEMRRFFEDLRLNEELQRLLASMVVELKMEVRFVPHDEQLRADVRRSRVRVRRQREPVPADPPPSPPDPAPAAEVPVSEPPGE